MNNTARLFIILFSIPLFCSCFAVVASPSKGKAQSPVTITVEAKQIPELRQAVDFVVRATSKFNTDNLVINVHPPKGMVLNSGELSWQGAANRGQTKMLRFNASFTEQSKQNVSVNAFVVSPSGSRFGAQAEYVLPWFQTPISSKSSHPRQRGDQAVVEYPIP